MDSKEMLMNQDQDELRSRLDSLEKKLEGKIRINRALIALIIFLSPLFLLDLDLHFGKEFSGGVRSRTIPPEYAASLVALGLGAVGAISKDEIAKYLLKSKD